VACQCFKASAYPLPVFGPCRRGLLALFCGLARFDFSTPEFKP
jgi:hypothetical protein